MSSQTQSVEKTLFPEINDAAVRREQPVNRMNVEKPVPESWDSRIKSLTIPKTKTEQLLSSYRSRVEEDMYSIKQAMKEKLAAYNLSTEIALSIEMNAAGKIEVKGSLNNPILAMIEIDLNRSVEIKNIFYDYKKSTSMLKYINQARRLQDAYGQANEVVGRLEIPQ